MADIQVPLYKCLYGMERFKDDFASDETVSNCMFKAISFYKERHMRGECVGPIDINMITVNLSSGDFGNVVSIPIEEAMERIETLKYLPPEIINGEASFGIPQDRYCLAILLFAIRYFSNPFEGEMVHRLPIVTQDVAKRVYGSPVFVFDIVDKSNTVSLQTDSRMIQLWERDSNSKVKDLFTTCFTAGIKNYDMRPDDEAWLNSLGKNANTTGGNRQDVLFIEVEGKRIRLSDGLEIFEDHLYEDGNPEKKIAVVLKSKKSDEILALGNTSGDTWSVYMPDSREIMVTPKSVAPLVKGTTISIGDLLVNITSEER